MAIQHGASGQVVDLGPLGPRLYEAKTFALFKSENFEVIRLVLCAGKRLPPHRVPGEITIQCLEGSIAVLADQRESVLHAGELLYLAGNEIHSLYAQEDSSALVTIALVKVDSETLEELTDRHSSGDA
jgi:quercetin dioxygenase-like cupin family protein